MNWVKAALLGLFLAAPGWAAAASVPQQIRFGLRVSPGEWAEAETLLETEPPDAANPVGLTVSIPSQWARNPDWPALDRLVAAARRVQAPLTVTTVLPGGAEEEETLRYLATLSDHAGAAASTLGLSLSQEQLSATLLEEPERLAFVLKRLLAALRGSSGAAVLIGEVTPADLPLMEPLYARDFRAYVEGYSAEAAGPEGQPPEEVASFLQSYHLGAPLLVHLPRVGGGLAAQLLVLVSASREVTFTDVASSDLPGTWRALNTLRRLLSPAAGPGFGLTATSVSSSGSPRPDVGLLTLLDPEKMVQSLLLVPRVAGSPRGLLEIAFPTGDVTTPSLFALPSGESREVGYTADPKKGETLFRVPWEGRPLLLSFSRLKTGTVGSDEVTVSSVYRLPVEVILARHQSAVQPQNLFLDTLRREAQVDYHFKLPGGTGSLDVTFENTFFWEKGAGARWVQKRLLVNGVAWKGKTIPELPILEPEKVNTLPLELTLGKDYTYRYVRDAHVEGYDCFEVEFVPAPGARGSLYTGKVWINKATYQKIRMSVRQLGLQEPMVSSEETDDYAPYEGPGGRVFWLLSRVRGQQIFSVAGQNVIGEREIRFGEPVVNDPAYRQEVAAAEGSDLRILAETPKGLKYLEKQPDGTRRIQENPKTGRLFAAGGFYYDESLSAPLPLVGVNYFDYDYRGTKTQVNLLVAGAVNSLTASRVNLLPRVDGFGSAVLFAVPFEDRLFAGGREEKGQRVKVLREYVSVGAGWRFQEFSKLSLSLGGRYLGFSRTSGTAPGFVTPRDHVDWKAEVGYDFAYRGWTLSAGYEMHRRSDWKPWGTRPTRNVDANKDYAQWSLALSKAFYLPRFQKIAASLVWLDGQDLDRFSRYQFTYMGRQSLAGFAGSGVRFDRGFLASVGYQFNLAEVIRFGVNLEHARVQPLKGAGLWQNHTGLGFSGSVAGPWQTFWTLDAGYALRSDIGPVKGDTTVALVVLKLW
ncbi:MAG: hypothetical protein ACP5VN_04340 [Acidobacteriota bacterium]